MSSNQQLVPPLKCQSSMQTGAEKCQPNPYQIIPGMCNYVDQQFIKLQEMPEDVPTGELPRHITLHLDRHLCERVQPGKRVLVVGIQTLAQGKVHRHALPPRLRLRPPNRRRLPTSATATAQPPSVTAQPPSVTPQPPSVTPQPPSVTRQRGAVRHPSPQGEQKGI